MSNKVKQSILLSILTVVTFAALPHAQALVDLKNANYSDAWVDMSLPGTGYDLKVERAYNSRTLYNGMFGFGWCSEFETYLDITPEGNLRLVTCGAGLEILFQAKGFSEKDVDRTVKAIIDRARAENTSAPSSYFSDLERRLKNESALRGEYANKYSIVRPIADKTRFYPSGNETDYIEKNGSNYVHVTVEGSTQRFKLNGRLEKVFDRNGNSLTFNFEDKRLRDVTDNMGRKILFTYFDNGKVKTITGPGNLKTEYKYKNLNDLIWAKASSGNVYTYDYDDLHNMTRVVFPDKTFKAMTYNKDKDWVTSYRDQEGCIESYDYKTSDDSPKDHFWSTVVKRCQNKVVTNAKYEFWYDTKSDRTGKYLKRSRTQENEVTTDIAYNQVGRPITVSRNNKVTKFDYYDNGLLKRKATADGVVTVFKYDNPFKKVSHVERGNKATDFTYDGKGNLIKAANSDGQRVSLSYDPNGRISTIEDQAHRKVNIKYEAKFGKPSVIEREGLGSISVTYTVRGDIAKVTPIAGNASVALQVASSFNNLLDLIQPAGVNLSF